MSTPPLSRLHSLVMIIVIGLYSQSPLVPGQQDGHWQLQAYIVFIACGVGVEERFFFPPTTVAEVPGSSHGPGLVMTLSQANGVLWSEFDGMASLGDGEGLKPTQIT